MALIPSLLRPTSDWWDLWCWPERIDDQFFGMGLDEDDFLPIVPTDCFAHPLNRHRHRRRKERGGTSKVVNSGDKFQVNLDVSQFKPEEINVKVVDNNSITIEGKHEEKQDSHGYISRQFVRRYVLPRNCQVDKVSSSLSSDGILSITAPKKAIEAPKSSEKVIPISLTPANETNDNKTVDKKY